MIAHAILFLGGMVMVFDEGGQQLPAYQGSITAVGEAILRDAPIDCRFSFGKFREGTLKVTREEWRNLAFPLRERPEELVFRVERTSHFDGTVQPCEEAVSRGASGTRWWAVEFGHLADLLAFGRKYGSLVLIPFPSVRPDLEPVPLLEIYDQHRE